jgi:hypothetical protein
LQMKFAALHLIVTLWQSRTLPQRVLLQRFVHLPLRASLICYW